MAPIVGAGAIVFDARGRLLLIERGRAPARGLWSVPGGKVEPGESPAEAVVREVAEETGLAVRVIREVGVVHRVADTGEEFVIHDFLCELLVPGEPIAADDAAAARFVEVDELPDLPLVPELLEALHEWDLVHRRPDE